MSVRIESILESIRSVREKNVVQGQCFVCHGPDSYKRKEDESKLFCSDHCNRTEFWFSELFQLGMKRKLEWSELRKTNFSDLPTEIQGYIILMAYNYELVGKDDWDLLLALRDFHFEDFPGEGPQLKGMIDTIVIPGIQFVAPHFLSRMTLNEISQFTGLTRILMPTNTKEWEEFDRENTLELGYIPKRPYGDWTVVILRMKSLRALTVYSTKANRKMKQTDLFVDLSKLTQIRELSSSNADDEALRRLTFLEDLTLTHSPRVVTGLGELMNLTKLNIGYSTEPDGSSLTLLTNLTELSFYANHRFQDNHLRTMTQLKSLSFGEDNIITGQSLLELMNLSSLSVRYAIGLNDDIMKQMTQLTWLDISRNEQISSESLTYLTNLTTLRLAWTNLPYRNWGNISLLSNLTKLDLRSNDGFNNYDINKLYKLTSLSLQSTYVTSHAIQNLSNLTRLNVRGNSTIGKDSIMNLIRQYGRLRELYLDIEKMRLEGWSELSPYVKLYEGSIYQSFEL